MPVPRGRRSVFACLLLLALFATGLMACASPAAAPAPASQPQAAAPTTAPAAPAAPAAKATDAPKAAAPTAAAAPAAKASGKELAIAISEDIGALDIRKEGSAASFSLLRHIYEPLVWFDDNMKLYPVLAESWEQVDPTTMRFKLRKDVKFHNGKPLTADAVKYSLEKALDPKGDAWMQFALDGLVKGATVVDPYTVDIQTTAPTPSLLWRLTLLDIVEPSYADSGQMDTKPMGTGPYKFVEFTPRQQLVMARNPDYWGKAPAIERITARILPEAGTRQAALQAGEVQMIDSVSPEMMKRIQESPNTTVTTAPTARLVYVALRNDRGPLANPKVRQAMNYAVDKKALTGTILKDISAQAQGPLPPSLTSSRQDLNYDYNPEKAKQLLKEAGYNGEKIVFGVGKGRYPNDGQVAEALVNYWQAVGLNIDFKQGEWAAMSAEARKGKDSPFDAFMQGWSADALDPVLMMDFLFNSKNTPSRTSYSNPKVDDNLKKAAVTNDPKALDTLLKDTEGMVWDDAPLVFLYYPLQVLGVSKNLNGFKARPDEFFFFTGSSLGQ
ncbi:MAG: ABC transporter substrate-binding protein [Anaerolineae bacterium]